MKVHNVQIDSEIYSQLESLNCNVEVSDGLVIITTPDGIVWTMGEPKQEHLEFEWPESMDIDGDIPQ